MEKGVWRTIGGRRVFIKDGQGLYDAMRESGKFKNIKDKNKKINTISRKDFDDLSNDYKGELKDLVKTASFRGENPEEVRKMYEKMGYNIEKDKTRLRLDEKNGTVLEPVKVVEEEKNIRGVRGQRDEYKNIEAYAGYKEKFNKTWGEEGLNGKSVSAKMYTNDEFMEHLEDANWHTERRMLIDAKLTNKQLEYVKDNTNVSAWGVDLDKEKTEKLISEAKNKYPKQTEVQRYSVTSNSIAKYNNLFTEYKRLHPNTKMSLQQFAKMMMDFD